MTNTFKRVKNISTVLSFAVLFVVSMAATAFAEQIQSYDITINVTKNSDFVVTEEIGYDFGDEYRHGIFRNIPTDHPQDDRSLFLDRYIDINILGVSMDNMPVKYDVQNDRKETVLKVGDPDLTITGLHTYSISYQVSGGLSYLEDGTTELYWNPISPEWEIPIRGVSVTLNDSDSVFKGLNSCYKGGYGGQSSCDSKLSEDGQVIFTAGSLNPYEGVTIAQEINSLKVERNFLERKKVAFFWIPALLIWFSALGFFTYQYRTQFKVDRSIIAQYEPYRDFKPMYTGLLFDGRLDPKDISAGILYLAQQGFLKIKKIDTKVLFFFEVDDYEIKLLKPVVHIESAFQKEILKLLFGPSAIVGNTVTLQDLKKNTKKQKENLQTLSYLKKDLEKDLEDSGFFQVIIPTYIMIIVPMVIIAPLIALSEFFLSILSTSFVFIGIGIVVSIFILLTAHRRRTAKGYEALWYLNGFKIFLSVTEKERYKFHNAPEKSPEQFMEYLPYAVAFGVEEKWAEVFKDITIPSPGWYEGGGSSFSAMNFTHSIGAFSTALASSSSSSASSGGGSVGGGGGGGGGGSW